MPDCTYKRSVGAQFTLTATVTTVGNTSYEWTVPAGLTIVSGGSVQTVTVECKSMGTYDGNNITVKVTNDCGSVIARASGTLRVLGDGQPGPDLQGEKGTYHTYVFPEDIGTWMITNSKEGTPTAKQYPGHEEGERGYYYSTSDALTACPNNWSLPTYEQAGRLFKYIGLYLSNSHALLPWRDTGLAGYYRISDDTWWYWDFCTTIWTESGFFFYEPANANNGVGDFSSVYWLPVRCIKN
jgi:hypothetical protein